MKNNRIIFLILFLLIGVTSYSIFKYVTITKEKYELFKELDQTKLQAAQLQKERLNLLDKLDKEREAQKQLIQDKAQLNDKLRAKEEKITKFNVDLLKAHNAIEKLNYQIEVLEKKSILLQDEKDQLTLKTIQVYQEKNQLQARLSSIPELKKAIKELKIQMHKSRIEIKKKLQGQRRMGDSAKTTTAGNSGFLLRDGIPTTSTKVTIEVFPASEPPKE